MLERVEVRPAVLVRHEHEAIVGGPVQVGAAGGARSESTSALPLFHASRAAGRRRLPRIDRRSRSPTAAAAARAALAACRRGRAGARTRSRVRRATTPATSRARSTARGSESAAPRREDADEAVVVAVRDEGQRAPVRRPRRRLARAAREERLLGGLRSVDRRDPDAAFALERHASLRGATAGVVAVAEQLRRRRRAAGTDHTCIFGCIGAAGRVRRQVAFGGPVRAVVAAAHVDDPSCRRAKTPGRSAPARRRAGTRVRRRAANSGASAT